MSCWTRMMTKPIRLLRNVAANVRQLGWSETTRLYRYRAYETYRDWRLGICTNGFIGRESLGHDPDCVDYEAVNYRCLDVVFRFLGVETDRDVFLDYGCGKGRAVAVAATYPFRRVIGVELSHDLSEIARQNLQSAAHGLECERVEIVTTDATDFKVPADVTVVFMFNPFRGRVLSAVQDKLRQSLQQTPRRLLVIYMHPVHQADEFAGCDFLAKQMELPTADWHEVRLVVYESRQPADAPRSAASEQTVEHALP